MLAALRERASNYPEACEIAERIYKHADGRSLAVLLILSPSIVDDEDPSTVEGIYRERLDRRRNSAVAAMAACVPDDAPVEIWLALTAQLDNAGVVWFSRTEVHNGDSIRVEATTEPIREIVHSKLVKAFGVDHNYDVFNWRATIISRVNRQE